MSRDTAKRAPLSIGPSLSRESPYAYRVISVGISEDMEIPDLLRNLEETIRYNRVESLSLTP